MARQANAPTPGQINMIGEGTVLEGTLRAAGDVRVSGRVVGKLQVEGKVIVTQEGSIQGEVIAASADVAGSVDGDISVEDRLVLKSTACVDGTIKTARLVVEEGAIFGGKCQMGQAGGLLPETAESARGQSSNGLEPQSVTVAHEQLPE